MTLELDHINGIYNDNRPENLVPLCPTHHQYMHSRFKNEILDIVEKYLEMWKQDQNHFINTHILNDCSND